MCRCKDLNKCEEALPTRDVFIKNFNKLDSNIEFWTELFVCSNCNQHWIVEKGSEVDRRSNKAYKIDTSENWKNYDTKPLLDEWTISQHGGLSDKECLRSGCKEKALKNMAVCIHHTA